MASMRRQGLEDSLTALGELLEARGQRYEIVVVGGGNLILRDLIARPTTKDIDLLGTMGPHGVVASAALPSPLAAAIADVALAFGLAPDWINLGPASLLDLGLPEGFNSRLERQDFRGLVVWYAGRFDMVCFKLYAAVDSGRRSRHFQDLTELAPSADELLIAARWTRTQDPSPGYRHVLMQTLARLGCEAPDAALE